MITCNIVGPGSPGGTFNHGLGNQLFIIATTISLAIDNDTDAVFPDLHNKEIYGSYTDNIFSKLNLGKNKNFVKYQYYEKKFSYNPIPFIDDLEINGYFQSEKYFAHNRDNILKIFNLDNTKFEPKTLGIHVRRGDYLKLKNIHPILSETNYYKSAIEYFENKHDTILVFSDDIAWCKNNFNDNRIIFVEGNSDIEDLTLMQKCGDMIIANSSFSWWGAWLNRNVNNVVAPINWFSENSKIDTKDIIPNKWKLM